MKKILFLTSVACLLFLGAGCSKSSSSSNTKLSDPTGGRLIKGTSYTTVYFLGPDNKRYVFPNDKTYTSWFNTFSHVKQISDEELMKTPLGGNVTYKPGVRLIKIDTDPKVYAVTRGGVLRWIKTEEVAEQLYGKDWRKLVEDLPDPFFTNYKEGQPILTFNDFSPENEVKNTVGIDQDKGLLATTSSTQP